MVGICVGWRKPIGAVFIIIWHGHDGVADNRIFLFDAVFVLMRIWSLVCMLFIIIGCSNWGKWR